MSVVEASKPTNNNFVPDEIVGTSKSRGSSGKSNVLIIVTGGTICMTHEGIGKSLCPAPLAERLRNMDDLSDSSLPTFDVLEWPDLIDSSDVNLRHWVQIASDVEKNYHDYDGFVILHGTDTLAYTASALSFMLENLNKPVILTGSMLPLSHIQTDARKNLAVALMIGAYSQITEVCILFGSRLLRGNRSRKLDCSQMDAFSSPNFPNLGRVGVDITIDDRLLLTPSKRGFSIFPRFCMNIVVITVTPGFQPILLQHLFASPTRPLAVILKLYGTGTAPVKDSSFLATIELGIRQGVEVVCLSQCPSGTCSLLTYENGALLYHLGVIEGKDMTAETAFAKLAYLMGKGYTRRELRMLMERDIRGELTQKPVKVTGQAYLLSYIPQNHTGPILPLSQLKLGQYESLPIGDQTESGKLSVFPFFEDGGHFSYSSGTPPTTHMNSAPQTPSTAAPKDGPLNALLSQLRNTSFHSDLHAETHPSIHTVKSELAQFGHSHFEVPDPTLGHPE